MTDKLAVTETLRRGVDAHKANNIKVAHHYYSIILREHPNHPDANHNMGILVAQLKNKKKALWYFKRAIDADPSFAQYWLSYIKLNIELGWITNAKVLLDKAKITIVDYADWDDVEKILKTKARHIRKEPISQPLNKRMQELTEQFKLGEFNKVFKHSKILLEKYSRYPKLWNLHGAAAGQIGQLTQAFDAFEMATDLDPEYTEAYNNMGNLLKRLGRQSEAIDAYYAAISLKPNFAEALNNLGNTLNKVGRQDDAIQVFNKLISIKPKNNAPYNNLGVIRREQGELELAIEAFKEALQINPNCNITNNNLGVALHNKGNFVEAINHFERAISIKPDYAEAFNNLGAVLQDKGNLIAAREAFKTAISIRPYYSEAHRNLSAISSYSKKDPQFLAVETLCKDPKLSASNKCNLHFTLAKMYEDLSNFDTAFEHLIKGNKLRKALLNYSLDSDRKLFTELKRCKPYIIKNLLGTQIYNNAIIPIFILGMPRSGTTLVEQIVSSHSAVTGAGELKIVPRFGHKLAIGKRSINVSSIQKFRKIYLTQLSKLSKGKEYVTDKLPHNFLYLPLLRTAFPEAKIIHVSRDPKATCWSNFRQYFTDSGLGYSYNLHDTVAYYKLYQDLINSWRTVYNDQVYDVCYDALTLNPQHEIYKLVCFLGLKWQKNCLTPEKNFRSIATASQQQVRKSIYKNSSEFWKNYLPYLNGILDDL